MGVGEQRTAELIARSSIGAGLANIRENGIGAELARLDEELAPKKKRKVSTSPTARTLAECRKRGWIAQVVERWNPHAHVRQDLFGVIDLIAIVQRDIADTQIGEWESPSILGIQATTGSNLAARRAKILAEPRARAWVEAGGRLELWTWAMQGAAGTRKKWTLRVETFAVVDGQLVARAQGAA